MLLRLVFRLLSHEADFFHGGYGFLFELAQGVASGRGYAFGGQPPTAYRAPLYPLFLAAVTFGREAFLPLAIAQSIVGAGTVFLVGVLTYELFGETRAALIAAGFAAIYPYYVVHDTA